MGTEEEAQQADLQPPKIGWTDKTAVIATDDPDTMLLRFVLFQPEGDTYIATPIQVAMETLAMMELMKAIQEMQRLLCIAVPEGELLLVRGDGDWPPVPNKTNPESTD